MSSRLRYETSLDDFMIFQDFHLAHSPAVKKQVFWARWGSVFVFLLLAFFTRTTPSAASIGLTAAVVFGLFIPGYFRLFARQATKKMYGTGNLKAMLGPNRIESTVDGLLTQNNLHEVKTQWAGIDHIASSATHTYIYNTPISAFVIPHDKITEGNIEEFLQDIEHHRAFAARLPA